MFLPPPQTLILRLRGPLPKTLTRGPRISPAMSVNLQTHAFAGNPLRSKLARPAGPCSPGSALETLKSLLAAGADEGSFKVLAFRKGRPLARSLEPVSDTPPRWRLGWVSPSKFKNSSVDDFVYLGPGSEGDADTVYWAIDVSSSPSGVGLGGGGEVWRLRVMYALWADNFLHFILQTAPVVIGHQDKQLRYRFIYNHFPRLEEEDFDGCC